jgi:hypothetical protein
MFLNTNKYKGFRNNVKDLKPKSAKMLIKGCIC